MQPNLALVTDIATVRVFCGIGYCASSKLRLTPFPHGTSDINANKAVHCTATFAL